jgi:lantibiotic modifying enzyme
MRNATSLLNEAGIPFRLKVLNDPMSFGRYDASVLYILRTDYEEAFRVLSKVYSKMTTTDLTRGTPALVMQIADGLGVADDPGGGESFGLHRCHLLAESIIRSEELKVRSVGEKIKILETHLLEAGIDPEKPYLGSGLEDIFTAKLNRSFGFNVPSPPKPLRRSNFNQTSFLDVAVTIGRRLALEAVWSEDKCNWLAPTPLDPRDKSFGRTHGALGPELYSGTSGVAFFLAELDRLVDQPLLRRTARGAIKHALSNSRTSLVKDGRLGLYTGVMGTVLVALRLAVSWDDVELRSMAMELVERAITAGASGVNDLLAGRAGMIVALLTLHSKTGDQTFLSDAITLGEALISDAVRSAEMCSWKSNGRPRPHQNLTGLSHGTAGIGQGLVELFKATNELKYSETAKLAFAYERHWFDSKEQNWPDFRQSLRRRERSPSCCAFWCHGAPGIALSRLRAYEILGSQIDRDEAEIALATTQREIESCLHGHRSNYSLCHGLSGNLEVLLHGAEILAGKWAEAKELAEAAAKFGIETYFATEEKWPCGTSLNDEIPSLMLGLAGIGYFYLRLADSSIPSILFIRSDRQTW